MKRFAFAIAATSILCAAQPAEAKRHHHRHAAHGHHRHAGGDRGAVHHGGGLVTVSTAGGHRITVAASAASRFRGFIAALEQRAHIRDIQCYSAGGHMPGSKHHWGGACDFDQRARSATVRVMYHVAALAHRFGLTDGCTWRNPDCGHIEVPTGGSLYTRRRHGWREAWLQ